VPVPVEEGATIMGVGWAAHKGYFILIEGGECACISLRPNKEFFTQ